MDSIGYSLQQKRIVDLVNFFPNCKFNNYASFLVDKKIDHKALFDLLAEQVKKANIFNAPENLIDVNSLITQSSLQRSFLLEKISRLYPVNDSEFYFDSSYGIHVIVSTVDTINGSSCLVTISAPALCSDFQSLFIILQNAIELLLSNGPVDDEQKKCLYYKNLVNWFDETANDTDGEYCRDYWRRSIQKNRESGNLGIDGDLWKFPQNRANKISSINVELDTPLDINKYPAPQLEFFCLTAWAILLQKYVRSNELFISYESSGRSLTELTSVFGPINKFVPLSINIDPSAAFESLYQLLDDILLKTIEFHDYFYWSLDKDLDISSSAMACGFQFINYHSAMGENGFNQGFSIAYVDGNSISEYHPIKLFCVKSDKNSLRVSIQFDEEIYSAEFISEIGRQWETILRKISPLSQADRQLLAIDDISCVGKLQAAQLLNKNNNNSQQIVRKSFLQYFMHSVNEKPDSLALVFEEESYTYSELDIKSNKLAHYLSSLGVNSGDNVAVCVEHPPYLIISILASHKMGASFTVVDGQWPHNRLAQVLNHSGASAVVTEQSYLQQVSDTDIDLILISLDRDDEDIDVLSGALFTPERQPEIKDTAYQVFTSGSTGVPKGVMVSHESLRDYLIGLFDIVNLEGTGEWLALSTPAADLGYTSLFGALASGGTLRQFPASYSLDAESISQSLANRPVDVLKIVPGHLSALLDINNPQRLLPRQYLILGGDVLSPALIERLFALAPDLNVINHYGPTETTIGAVAYRLDKSDAQASRIPIGRPLLNRKAYVLDKNMELQGIGIVGDLYLGGDGLADGYRGQPAMTASSFLPNPWGDYGQRIYKTGDLARYRSDGLIDFFGRGDFQIKRRGHRIELGEIERVLSNCEYVGQIVVLYKDEKLLSFVVVNNSLTADDCSSALIEYANQSLPEVMRPDRWIFVPGIPLTLNGKIDRTALLELQDDRNIDRHIEEPKNNAESIFVALWSQLLRFDKVGTTDNFFRLGGDSIIVIQMVARARDSGLSIQPNDVYEHPTIVELALIATPISVNSIDQSEVIGEQVLSPRQADYMDTFGDSVETFSRLRVLIVNENLDSIAMNRALHHVLCHHDALRLQIVRKDNKWVQHFSHISDKEEASILEDYEVSIAEESAIESHLYALLDELRWDLSKNRLFRAIQIKGSEQVKTRLVLAAHPVVIDGMSWRIIQEDLLSLYDLFKNNHNAEPKLPLKTNSYYHWVEYLSSTKVEKCNRDIQYWQSVAGKSVIPLSEAPFEVKAEYPSRIMRKALSETLSHELLERANIAYNTEVKDLILTAFAVAYCNTVKTNNLLIDMEAHGRDDHDSSFDISRTVGWFASIFPVALDLADSSSLVEALKSVKEQRHNVHNKGTSYGVLRYLHPDPQVRSSLKRNIPQEIFFTYLGQFDQQMSKVGAIIAGEKIGNSAGYNKDGSYKLEIHSSFFDKILNIEFRYYEGLVSDRIINSIMADTISNLELLIELCRVESVAGYTPSDFPLIDVSQKNLDKLLCKIAPKKSDLANIDTIYPMSSLQQGMLSRSLIYPASGVYIIQHVYEIEGALDVAAFKDAWYDVIQRHEVFRSVFINLDGEKPLQVVKKNIELPWQEFDFSNLEQQAKNNSIEKVLNHTLFTDYEYSKAPLIRLNLIRLANDQYRFIWDCHHIIADGWSSGVVWHEILVLYNSKITGIRSSLPKPGNIGQLVLWRQAQPLNAQREFWSTYLQDAPYTKLPFQSLINQSHLSDANMMGQLQSKELPRVNQWNWTENAVLLRELIQLAKNNAVTLNTIIQAAWSKLLASYSGESEIVFGATVSGRSSTLANAENMVSLLLNTVPVRVKIDEGISLSELLINLHQNYVKCESSCYLPLSEIQKCSSDNASALFETIIVFENLPGGVKISGSSIPKVKRIHGASYNHYPLSLVVYPDESLHFSLKYDERYFDAEEINRIATHLGKTLQQFCLNSLAPVTDINSYPDDELKKIKTWSKRTSGNQDALPSFIETFEYHAVYSPQADALVYEGKIFSYADLDKAANKLAQYLKSAGVLEQDVLGICLDISPYTIISLLATLKLGAIFTIVDPHWPQLRLQQVIETCNARILVTEQQFLDDIAEAAPEIELISLDRDWAEIDSLSVEQIDKSVRYPIDNIAYYVFTSGSTGTPKGVAINNTALSFYVDGILSQLDLRHPCEWLALSTPSADLGHTAIFGALASGGTLRQMPSDFALDAAKVATSLAKRPVDIFKVVPGHLNALLTSSMAKNILPKKYLILGGDVLSPSLVRKIHGLMPSLKIINHYGPSETTIGVLTHLVHPGHTYSIVPIGAALPHRDVYILDKAMNLAGIGVMGEVYIGGEGVAYGYQGQGALTAEKFLPNPWGENGSRLYRTGDLGRYNIKGDIEFFGRQDYQIKRRGFRIELGEIEKIIAQHNLIQRVLVRFKDEKLIAYILIDKDQINDSLKNDIQHFSQKRLSEVMQPNRWVYLDNLPLTKNGKIDEVALHSLAKNANEVIESARAPQNIVEEKLVDLWKQLLGVDVVDTTDNFFRLGGDSIGVIQLVSRARETGIQLKPAQIFEYPTIIELANVCELIETLKAEQGIVTGVSMLTPIQRHFFKQVTSDAGHYNQTEVISFSGEINARYLIETLDSLIVQHDVLRSSFNVEALQSHEISGWKEGQAEQLIIKIDGKPTYTFEMVDVEREIIKFNTSFDLKNDNLVKVLWFDSKEKSYIAFIIHHLIIDGVSWRILLEDFEKCYMALANGSSINLPGKTTSYFDWSKVLLKASVENYWDDEISYWCGLQQQLVSKLPIPNDSKNTRDLSLYVEQELDRDTTDLLMTKAHYAFGTEVNDLLLSALLLSFKSCMEIEELLIDLEGHGREDLFLECDISRTVGWFTSIFPVLLADGGPGTENKNVGSLVKHIKEMLRGVPRKGVGFGNLVYLGNENEYQELRQIKPDVRFNYFGKIDTQANKISKFHRQRLSVYANHSPNQVRPYALNINAAISDGVFRINFDYNKEQFSSENIQLLAENYIVMLKDIVLYCCDCEFTTLTPSDVPEASLNQKELDDLIFELEYLNMEKTEESIV